MKKMYLAFLLLILFLISACQDPRQQRYTIKIFASQGIEFSGSISGGGNSRTIEGIGQGETPLNYEVVGWPAVAVIQKKEEYGKLIVAILDSSGNILQQQSTDAAYGMVTVSSG